MQSLTRGVLGGGPRPRRRKPWASEVSPASVGDLVSWAQTLPPEGVAAAQGKQPAWGHSQDPGAGSREPGASLPLLLPLPLAPPPPLWAEPPQDWPAKPEGGLQVPSPSLQAKFRRVGAELGDDH